MLGGCLLCLATILLVVRVRALSHANDLVLGDRPIQLVYMRMLAVRVKNYAQRSGRPAYSLDSVAAHLDSGEVRLFRDLSTDLWGSPLGYTWSGSSFTLSSSAGFRVLHGWPPNEGLFETYWWPDNARRALQDRASPRGPSST
jgi:hypothetical protein